MITDIVPMFMMVLKCRAVTILGFILEANKCFRGACWYPYSSDFLRDRNKPLDLFLSDQRHPAPIRVYNKPRYLVVHSSSAPDTLWSLSRASTGPILNMVRRSPSIFNNQPRLTCIRKYIEWDIYRSIQIG